MKLPLILRIFKENQLKEVKQFDQEQIVIGHNAEVHLDLDSGNVSAIHCLIEKRDNGYYICDLGSQSGTFKNGQAILDERLESGDEINIGDFKIHFFVGAPKPKAAPQGVAAAAPPVKAKEEVIEIRPEEIKKELEIKPVVIESKAADKPNEKESEKPAEKIVDKPAVAVVAAPLAETAKAAAQPEQTAPAAAIPDKAPAVVNTPSEQTKAAIPASNVTPKPEIKSAKVQQQKKKKSGTFAPPSDIKDIRSHLKPGKGQNVEVIVIWGDRILNTYNFSDKALIKVGHDENQHEITLPQSFLKQGFPVLDLRNGVRIQATHELDITVKSTDEIMPESNNKVTSRLQSVQIGKSIRLEQNEVVFVSSRNTPLQMAVRFTAQPPIVSLIPPFILSASEISALVIAIVLMGLLKFYIDSTIPQDLNASEQEEVQRVAQVIFNPPPKAPPPPELPAEPPTPQPTPPPPPPKPPEKVQAADKTKEATKKSEQPKVAPAKTQVAAKAAEVAPKPDTKNRPKSFTSTKQGGAVKTGETAGANAQSANKDPKTVGLLSAFGSGGVRQKLDQAYSGSGELLGMADKATGTSGFNENRAGDDLGSRFKDTGAGGKGTATQGIAGVGTKGRSSGNSAYGAADGFGDKTSTSVQPGGAEESFVGTIDREAIRRVIRAKLHEVKSCYERVLNTMPKGQRLEGKVVIKWEIVERGQARAARVKTSSLRNGAVESCIVSRLQTWVFPEPPANTVAEVEYPFVLNQAN